MKTIEGRIGDIRKELDVMEAQILNLRQDTPEAQQQIDWLIDNIQYVIDEISRVEHAPGKRKSYSELSCRVRERLELTIKNTNNWRLYGLKPYTAEWVPGKRQS